MERDVIERSMPGVGRLTDDEFRDLSDRYGRVAHDLDRIVRVESFVRGDTPFSAFEAQRPAPIRQRAAHGGFGRDRMEPVRRTISPADGT